ncbi:MAG: mucoidy inhibitor MuiA family protein [Chloroflexi bacterium]|nr:mucoidy inhibitor MuiA family protein [Chloroflexota bacterium]
MVDINSAIVEVTLFPDRARVTRRGQLTLEPGVHRIVFSDLPLSLDTDSVRAAGRGTAVASLLGVDTRSTYFSETPAANARDLEKQIEALTQIDAELTNRTSVAEVNIAFVKKLADQSAEQLARGLALGRAQIGQGDDLVSFVSRQMAQGQATLRELAVMRRDNQREIDRLKKELERVQSAQPRERYEASVEVSVQKAGDLTVELIYMLDDASWAALYDVRASGTEGDGAALSLAYLAEITQNTSEEWKDVTLTLSTARPALATIRPGLTPWYLDIYMPRPMSAKRAMPPGFAMAAAPAPMMQADMMVSGAGAPEAEMEAPQAVVDSEGAAVTYRLAQTVSVPSDGTPHKVTISTIELKPRMDYISVPKLTESAFRRAKVTNASEYTILPGRANLFLDGDFIGSTNLKLVAPNEEFELALGVDDRIFVKRKLVTRDVDKAFIIGDRRRLRVGYEIELRNLRTVKSALDVRDQLPVPRNEQIKVKLESADPRPGEQTDLGELKWLLALAPNEKKFLRFEFTIEHPAQQTVEGLP